MPINESQLNKALNSQTEKIQQIVKEANENFVKAAGSLTTTVQELANTVKLLQGHVNLQDAKIALVETSVLEVKADILEVKMIKLEQNKDIKGLENKLETLEIRARTKNLKIYGMKEEATETRPALQRKICELLKEHYGMVNISLELPSRLPTKDAKKERPVLVSFHSKSDRDSILYRKVPPGCPVVFRADLPPTTAAKRAVLGRLTRWAKDNPDKVKKIKRTDHFVELDGTRYDHVEAKDFLDAFPKRRQSEAEENPESPMSSG